jgi:hypothetical protein
MHWTYGDANEIYAGAYPELHDWSRVKLTELLDGAGLRVIDCEIIARTYYGVKRNAAWYVMTFKKVKP